MPVLPILTFPDPVLRQKCAPVTKFDTSLEELCANMLETMYDAPGVGLAAIQVGVALQLIVIDIDYRVEGEDESDRRYLGQNPQIFINPKIDQKRGESKYKEGCLSVPGVYEDVARPAQVRVHYQDAKGANHVLEASGLLATALQHEIDHLEGKLFLDRLSLAKRGLLKSKIRKERLKKFDRSKFHVEL